MIDNLILLKTPLHAFDLGEGAKMSSFAGYDIPHSYPKSAVAEHKLCLAGVTIFDALHMGQIELRDGAGVPDKILAIENLSVHVPR